MKWSRWLFIAALGAGFLLAQAYYELRKEVVKSHESSTHVAVETR